MGRHQPGARAGRHKAPQGLGLGWGTTAHPRAGPTLHISPAEGWSAPQELPAQLQPDLAFEGGLPGHEGKQLRVLAVGWRGLVDEVPGQALLIASIACCGRGAGRRGQNMRGEANCQSLAGLWQTLAHSRATFWHRGWGKPRQHTTQQGAAKSQQTRLCQHRRPTLRARASERAARTSSFQRLLEHAHPTPSSFASRTLPHFPSRTLQNLPEASKPSRTFQNLQDLLWPRQHRRQRQQQRGQ